MLEATGADTCKNLGEPRSCEQNGTFYQYYGGLGKCGLVGDDKFSMTTDNTKDFTQEWKSSTQIKEIPAGGTTEVDVDATD